MNVTHAAPDIARGQAARRVGAVCSWTLGAGFGLPCLYGIWHVARYDEIATFLGFPTYGKGPFDAVGIPTTVPLLAAFLGVCTAEACAGWLLWSGRRAGLVLALSLLPFEAVFWIGFDLPYGPPLGIARTAAVLAAIWSGTSTGGRAIRRAVHRNG